jgi:dihydrofolate reductase
MGKPMTVSIIVAMAENRVIGLKNQLPWHLSADLKRFKQITMGFPIIMGRKTYESIGRPLPGRQNIIISRNPSFKAEGCQVFHDLDDAIQMAVSAYEQVFVIGGATLYAEALKWASRIYLTQVHAQIDGDTFFPEFASLDWSETHRETFDDDPTVDFSYSFIQFERR